MPPILPRNPFFLSIAFFIFIVGVSATEECLAGKNAQSWILHGEELSAGGKHQEASQAFQKAVQVDPVSEDAYLHLGNSYYELGSYEAAADAFRHVLKINPANGTAQFYLGLSLIQQKKYDESIPHFEKAGRLDSDFRQLSLFYIGKAHSEFGNLQAASEAWQQAIEVDPKTDIALKTQALIDTVAHKKDE